MSTLPRPSPSVRPRRNTGASTISRPVDIRIQNICPPSPHPQQLPFPGACTLDAPVQLSSPASTALGSPQNSLTSPQSGSTSAMTTPYDSPCAHVSNGHADAPVAGSGWWEFGPAEPPLPHAMRQYASIPQAPSCRQPLKPKGRKTKRHEGKRQGNLWATKSTPDLSSCEGLQTFSQQMLLFPMPPGEQVARPPMPTHDVNFVPFPCAEVPHPFPAPTSGIQGMPAESRRRRNLSGFLTHRRKNTGRSREALPAVAVGRPGGGIFPDAYPVPIHEQFGPIPPVTTGPDFQGGHGLARSPTIAVGQHEAPMSAFEEESTERRTGNTLKQATQKLRRLAINFRREYIQLPAMLVESGTHPTAFRAAKIVPPQREAQPCRESEVAPPAAMDLETAAQPEQEIALPIRWDPLPHPGWESDGAEAHPSGNSAPVQIISHQPPVGENGVVGLGLHMNGAAVPVMPPMPPSFTDLEQGLQVYKAREGAARLPETAHFLPLLRHPNEVSKWSATDSSEDHSAAHYMSCTSSPAQSHIRGPRRLMPSRSASQSQQDEESAGQGEDSDATGLAEKLVAARRSSDALGLAAQLHHHLTDVTEGQEEAEVLLDDPSGQLPAITVDSASLSGEQRRSRFPTVESNYIDDYEEGENATHRSVPVGAGFGPGLRPPSVEVTSDQTEERKCLEHLVASAADGSDRVNTPSATEYHSAEEAIERALAVVNVPESAPASKEISFQTMPGSYDGGEASGNDVSASNGSTASDLLEYIDAFQSATSSADEADDESEGRPARSLQGHALGDGPVVAPPSFKPLAKIPLPSTTIPFPPGSTLGRSLTSDHRTGAKPLRGAKSTCSLRHAPGQGHTPRILRSANSTRTLRQARGQGRDASPLDRHYYLNINANLVPDSANGTTDAVENGSADTAVAETTAPARERPARPPSHLLPFLLPLPRGLPTSVISALERNHTYWRNSLTSEPSEDALPCHPDAVVAGRSGNTYLPGASGNKF